MTPSVDVSLDRLEVVDAAFGSRPGRNEDALRVENTEDFRVGWLEVGRQEAKTSCYAGVYLNGASVSPSTAATSTAPPGRWC